MRDYFDNHTNLAYEAEREDRHAFGARYNDRLSIDFNDVNGPSAADLYY